MALALKYWHRKKMIRQMGVHLNHLKPQAFVPSILNPRYNEPRGGRPIPWVIHLVLRGSHGE